MGTTQLFCAATQYAAATLTAALRAGRFGPRSGHRRILVVSDTSASPELNTPLDRMSGFEALRDEFDEIRSWNEFIRPFHPAGWFPREQDTILWERTLRDAWSLGNESVEIACESIQANPSNAIAKIFSEAPLHVYADGLMSYGPTRNKIDPLVGTRVVRLLHLDLVPGLEPLLLTEFGVKAEVVPTEAFLKVLGELGDSAEALPAFEEAPALLLGQYLSAIDVLTPEEEEGLHLDMVRGAVAHGHRQLVFKPHPSAPAGWSRLLREEAEKLGAEFTLLDTPVLAEVVYQRLRPALVVACFSTALLTAATFYGLPVARTGTDLLLKRLTPYQNSNRIPVTVVDALLPDLADEKQVTGWPPPAPSSAQGELADLVASVGYAMQPQLHPALRARAEQYLAARLTSASAPAWRYFTRKRLTRLGMPGAVPPRLAPATRNPAVRRIARKALALKARLGR